MPGELFREAVALARLEKKGEARVLLELVLKDNPTNETAWVWLADCAPTLEERVHTLERCLQVIPDARMARIGLEKLRREQAVSPNGIETQQVTDAVQAPEPEVQAPEPEIHIPEPDQDAEPPHQESNASPFAVQPADSSYRLPVQQFPVQGDPAATSRTQPVRVKKPEPAIPVPPPEISLEDELLAWSETRAKKGTGAETFQAPERQPERNPPGRAAIFDQPEPPVQEPNPFTVNPGDYPNVTPHAPAMKPLKAQIERRLERDLGLDVPLPPDPTQRIHVRPKQHRLGRGMILLYVTIALIALLGIAAFLAGLALSGR